MDIDHFKKINDAYGHQAGDHALKMLAQSLLSHIRQSDIACRYGGEEFMVILPDTDAAAAEKKAEVFRKSVHDLKIEFEGQVFSITLSIGLRCSRSWIENDQILSHADAALYAAKKSGRDKVVIYSPDGMNNK
jgi:diguanylate cyclase (GGDEF)-like protein